jgi:hypothetical protein
VFVPSAFLYLYAFHLPSARLAAADGASCHAMLMLKAFVHVGYGEGAFTQFIFSLLSLRLFFIDRF